MPSETDVAPKAIYGLGWNWKSLGTFNFRQTNIAPCYTCKCPNEPDELDPKTYLKVRMNEMN